MLPQAFTLFFIFAYILVGMLLCLGWSAMITLWGLLGARGQLIASVILLVIALVVIVLTYRGG